MGNSRAIKIKQDINFLDKPLWFLNFNHDGRGFVWNDIEGYLYRSSYVPPDKVDILILIFLLSLSQQEEYQSGVICSRYEILKACGFPINAQYYERLKDSLTRWSSVTIHFEGSFYDGGQYLSKDFHIMKGSIDEESKQVEIDFDVDWLLKIKESRYYKYINFGYYKALTRPISRRLHELLCKEFFGRSTYHIKLIRLGQKIPLSGRETKRGPVIYASDVLTAVTPAINEINQLASDPEILEKTGIKPQDLFTVSYKITGEKQERVIHFTRHSVCFAQSKEKALELCELLATLTKRSKKIEAAVAEYHQRQGYEYVRWNIIYTNQNAEKNYAAYLKKALAENWAEEWAEEERNRIADSLKYEEDARRKALAERARELEEQRARREHPLFLEAVEKLEPSVKQRLWSDADNLVPAQTFRRENVVKVQYLGMLWEHLNESGSDFCKAIADDLRIAFELNNPSSESATQRE